MKFTILTLLLLISVEVFGSRHSDRSRKSSSTCGKRQLHRRGNHLGGPRAGQGLFPW